MSGDGANRHAGDKRPMDEMSGSNDSSADEAATDLYLRRGGPRWHGSGRVRTAPTQAALRERMAMRAAAAAAAIEAAEQQAAKDAAQAAAIAAVDAELDADFEKVEAEVAAEQAAAAVKPQEPQE
tara:strand:+ start:361 stop:735 length:375 start_codon:yes stop_codon:yes gene_type:complete